MPGSASSASAVRGQSDTSRSTIAVMSSGLSSEAKAGSTVFSLSIVAGASRGTSKADLVAEVEREAFDCARVGDDARPLYRRLAARQQLGDVDQFIDGLDHD